MGLNETEVAVSLRDNNGTTLLNNVLPLQWPGCLFPYIVNYEWWCSDPNSSYQIQVDSTHGGYTTSRTQVVPCVDKGNSPCAHGVYDANIQTCSCDVHWSGTSCQERICQNGGVTMPNNTCSCDSEKYDGDFCQISLENCNSSPDAPYIANEVSSLILVAERLSTPLNLITSADTLKALLGIQIVVVYYGGGLSPSLVLSTTDSSLLPLTLTNYPFENVNSTAPPESPNDAIILGLRSQMTARSLVVLLSRGGDFPVSSALVNELSNRRAELRVFSGKDTLNSTTLAALGNGIPFVIGNRREFEQDYFPNYVVPAASKATLLSSPTLNVIASDNMCNVALTIPAESFSSKLTMFIHTRNSDSSLVDVAVSQGGNVIMNSAKIGQITQKFIISSDVDTSVNIGGSDRCSYSIEMLNYYKIGYTFQSDNLAENGYQGPSDGLNFVSLYAANSLVDYLSSAPYIHLRPIMSDGTLGAATLAATTMRVMSCTYDYYAELSCDGGALGYQAQIHTFLTPSANRQQQVAMACIQQDTCSGNGQQVRGICVCNGGWDGPDCSLPKCVNGGSRLETVCGCPPRYTGVFCEEEMFRNIAFIVDSIGLDDTAFNSSITSMIEFVGLYDMQELRILLIDNADALSLNQNFVTYTTESFSASLNAIFPNRNRANEPKLDEVFSTIDNKTVELNGQHYIFRYIFYVTQTGGSVLDSSILDKVKNQLGFRITCIGVSAHNRTLSEETLGELRLIGSTQTADNWYTAMTEMADVLSYVENTLPIPPPTPLCPNAQMSIFFAVDLSTGVDQYRDTMLSVISQLPTAFNLGYDTLSDNTGCDESGDITAAYKGSSRISGWTYYDKFLGVASPSLCVSNLPTVMKSVENDVASGPDPQFSGSRGLLRTFSQILNNTCLCSRYTDSVTTKAVIWMPISNYTSPDFVQLLGTPYIHYVVPFYDLYAGDFFYGLSRNKGAYDGALPNVAGMSSDTIVDMLWSKLCGDQKPK